MNTPEFNIEPLSKALDEALQKKIDLKTKPVGALGMLEHIAFQIGNIQQSLTPQLNKPNITIFAADHGIAKTGLVNPYPQEVTYQMVLNFLSGGAAINVFAKQHNIALNIVDAGVNYVFGKIDGLIDAKIAFGTANYLHENALKEVQALAAIEKGSTIVSQLFETGCNIIGFGEMGIGNTAAAALLMSEICSLPIETCVGNGTGANKIQLTQKIETLKKVKQKHDNPKNILDTLCCFGGFEIAQMCGGILKAAELGMTIMIDGFISTAALLVAHKLNPLVLPYCLFTHCSDEQGHTKMLNFLNVKPILHLSLRLGEGTGCALAYPLLQAACNFLNEMASFESAKVSNKEGK